MQIVSADHRLEVFAEIEYGGDIFAEAFVEDGHMAVAFMNAEGDQLWVASV